MHSAHVYLNTESVIQHFAPMAGVEHRLIRAFSAILFRERNELQWYTANVIVDYYPPLPVLPARNLC